MALTRQFLMDLGLEKDVMQKVLDEHGETIKTTKQAAKEDAEESLNKKIKTLEGEKAALEKQAKDAHGDGKDWKAEHDTLATELAALKTERDTLKGEFDTFKTTTENEKTTAAKRAALRSHLKAEGANEKLVELLEGKFDLAAIEIDGEKIKGFDKLVKPVKEQFSEIFGTVETKGVDAATPPAGQQATFTLDQVKTMTPAQINANWDKGVKQALEGGKK